MCDPVTLMATAAAAGSAVKSVAGLAATGAGIAANLKGIELGKQAAKLGGEYGKMSADLDAAVADFNADLLHDQADLQRAGADLPLAAGALAERRLRATVDATLGSETARFAAAGVDAASGSPLLLETYTASQGELDRGIIRARAQRERASILTTAASTDVAGVNQEYAEIAAKLRGEYALKAGEIGAATAMVQGASKWPGLIKSAASDISNLITSAGSMGSGNAFVPSDAFMSNSWGW